jgi:TRAP-type C4-dicarboxylate transport system permease small subunit
MRERVLRLLDMVHQIRNRAIVTVFFLMTFTYCLAFTSRYFPVIGTFNWAEELTRFLHVWLLFLSIGYVIRTGSHISMDVLVHAVPRPAQRRLAMLSDAAFVLLLLVFLVYGIRMTGVNMTQDAPSLRMIDIEWLMGWPVRMGWPYLAIPVGAGLAMCDLLAARLQTKGWKVAGEETADFRL